MTSFLPWFLLDTKVIVRKHWSRDLLVQVAYCKEMIFHDIVQCWIRDVIRWLETWMTPPGICKHHTFTANNFVLLLFTGDFTFHTLQQIKLDSRRETSKSELSRNLKRTAQEKGFVISDNRGEGNCMFFALSEQLDVVKGRRMSHEEIRQNVVYYLMDHPTLVSRNTNL